MLCKVNSAAILDILDTKTRDLTTTGYDAETQLDFGTNTGYLELVLNFSGSFYDARANRYVNKWSCTIQILEDGVNTYSNTIQAPWDETYRTTNFNLTQNVSIWKGIKWIIHLNNGNYSNKQDKSSWTAILYGKELLIEYKKIKAFSNINIWEKLNGYLFGMLPNGERRDGN